MASETQTSWPVRSARVGELCAYWTAKRGERAMASRADIDPTEIRHLLPSLIIADLSPDPLRVTYRLAGTQICETFGFNLAGRCLHELDVIGGLAFWEAQYGRMMASKKPVFGSTVGTVGRVEYFRSDWALLPLSLDGIVANQVLEIEDWICNRPMARFNDPQITWQVSAID